ncbi:hypothetical protein Tco_0120748, partial [Tanacetum coccineum]
MKDQMKSYDEQVKKYEDRRLIYEVQLKNLEDEVKDLNELLSAAHDEIMTKENVVKQHAKVAKDAVSSMSAWGQIRNLKEEHTQNVYDVVVAKTKQWDKLKLEFDVK